MPACQFFNRQGCQEEATCVFLHINDAVQKREISNQSCESYARGFCRFGAKCSRNHHMQPLLCPNYLAGFCPSGSKCSFGHPKLLYRK
jgi:cleavage and polyadenylation specificity factor subunit 4